MEAIVARPRQAPCQWVLELVTTAATVEAAAAPVTRTISWRTIAAATSAWPEKLLAAPLDAPIFGK